VRQDSRPNRSHTCGRVAGLPQSISARVGRVFLNIEVAVARV
jgi:hypothetical protein